MVREGSDDVAYVIGVASEGRVLWVHGVVLKLPEYGVYFLCFIVTAAVQVCEEFPKLRAPVLAIRLAFEFQRQFRRSGCLHGLVEVPSLASGLFEQF